MCVEFVCFALYVCVGECVPCSVYVGEIVCFDLYLCSKMYGLICLCVGACMALSVLGESVCIEQLYGRIVFVGAFLWQIMHSGEFVCRFVPECSMVIVCRRMFV